MGRFDTDSEALEQRIESHQQYGTNDLDAWIFEHLQPQPGDRILDLGCGTGKQSLPLAHRVGESGHIVSVDVSEQSISVLLASAEEEGISDRIRPVCSNFDEVDKLISGQIFERVLASYSLYYSSRRTALVEAVHRALRTGGVLFFCGPNSRNNLELKNLHYGLSGTPPPLTTDSAAFMEVKGPELAARLFATVEAFTFENPLSFDSVDALYRYWRHYNLYQEDLTESFLGAAERHFAEQSSFLTVKRVAGVKAIK